MITHVRMCVIPICITLNPGIIHKCFCRNMQSQAFTFQMFWDLHKNAQVISQVAMTYINPEIDKEIKQSNTHGLNVM